MNLREQHDHGARPALVNAKEKQADKDCRAEAQAAQHALTGEALIGQGTHDQRGNHRGDGAGAPHVVDDQRGVAVGGQHAAEIDVPEAQREAHDEKHRGEFLALGCWGVGHGIGILPGR